MTGNFLSAPDRAVPNRGHPRGVARKNWHGYLDPGRTADGNAVCWEDLRFKRRKAMIRTYPWSEASMERIIFKDCSLYREESFHDFPGRVTGVRAPVTITAYHEATGKIGACHEAAFRDFIANAHRYEQILLNFLAVTACRHNVELALKANAHAELGASLREHLFRPVEGLKKQIFWEGLGLFDYGWDFVGFCIFDFNCSWNKGNRFSLLWHKGKILADTSSGDISLLETLSSLMPSADCTLSDR